MEKQLHIFRSIGALILLLVAQSFAFAQDRIVSGKVTSHEGEPLPGVNILITGTSNGTVTDADGNYSIEVPEENNMLKFSYIGYTVVEQEINGRSQIDVVMTPDIAELSEIVVIGYGEQKRETLTGSISQVEGRELAKSPQPNVSSSLAGRFSGLIANNRAGEPGYDDSEFYIRGTATTGNKDVLVVIDGVPGQIGGLNRLNPNDIESISILKDASAAIYGSRAANGVILVTTKRGQTGKPKIDYSFDLGLSSPTRLPEMANAATYAAILNEIEYYNNPAGGLNQIYTEDEIATFADGSDPLNYPNTDWAEATLKKVALQSQHNLSITGGTEDVRYFASLGALAQDGLYKKGITKFEQYSFRSNIDANVTEHLEVSLGLSGRQEERQFPVYGAGDIFRSIYRAYPYVADVYPNGLPSIGIEGNNPVIMVTDIGGMDNNPRQIFNGILKARLAIPGVEGLSVDGFYAVDKSWNFAKKFSKPYILYDYNPNDGTYNERITGGSANRARLDESHNNQTLSTSNIKLNFERQLGRHHINTFVAFEQSKRSEENFNAWRLNYSTVETPELSQGGSAPEDEYNDGWSSAFARRSYIGRIAYNFSEKYLAEVQMRIDGSSIFPKGKQYGYFPAVSAGWRLSEEQWFQNVSFIDDLKIRASFGRLGNDNVGQFQYYNNYGFNSGYVIGGSPYPGIDLIKLANENITWEVAEKTDIGLNADLFNGLSLEVIYFQQKRRDILENRNASIPGVTGIVNPHGSDPLVPSENIGKVNSAGWEGTLGYRKASGDFWYNVSGNITYAKSEIIFIDEAPSVLAYQRRTGRPLNTYLLYNAIGIFRSEDELDDYPHFAGAKPGDLIYEDYNDDGELTADDMIRTEYGNLPQLTFGLNLNAGWKNFDLSVLFAGQGMVRQYLLPESGTIGNFYSSWADNRWSPVNTDGSYPRVDTRASSSYSGGQYRNNFWLHNASFLRLKNVAIGYNLPESLISRFNIEALRVNVNAFNLFTLTKMKDFDPEGSHEGGHFYPQQRIINLGVNVQF